MDWSNGYLENVSKKIMGTIFICWNVETKREDVSSMQKLTSLTSCFWVGRGRRRHLKLLPQMGSVLGTEPIRLSWEKNEKGRIEIYLTYYT